MDVTELARHVRQNQEDIITEVLFLDWFGVSPSDELRLLETDNDKAIKMMRHANYDGWIFDVGVYFEGDIVINGLRHCVSVMMFNEGHEAKYRVRLKFASLLKYSKYGDNLVRLLVDMLKARF